MNPLKLQILLGAVDKLTAPLKAVSGQSRITAKDLVDTKKKIRDLETQAGQIEGYKTLGAQIGATKAQLKQAEGSFSELQRKIAETPKPTRVMINEFNKAEKALSQLKTKQGEMITRHAQMGEAMRKTGINTGNLSETQRRLKTDLAAANTVLDSQRTKLGQLADQQKRLNQVKANYRQTQELRGQIAGHGAAGIAAGTAIGLPVYSAIKEYSGFEDAMKGVAKQVAGARTDSGQLTDVYYDMAKAIKDIAEEIPQLNGAIDIAALVEGGARMGIQGKENLLAFAKTTAKAATAFGLPTEQLADDMGKIANLYKIPIRDIEQLGDAINFLDDNAQSKGGDIINVLQRMGGVADKLDYKKAAALGSTFLSLGASAEVAASASNAMVRELSIATMQSKQFHAGLAELSLNGADIERRMTKDAMGTISMVLAKIKTLKPEAQLRVTTQLFGKEYGDDAAKLANNMPELNRQLELTTSVKSKGSMQRESDIDKDSLSSQWLLLQAGMANVKSALGEQLRGSLLDIIGVIQKTVGAVRRWVEANPELANTIVKVAAAVSVITIAFGGLSLAVAALLGPMAIMRFSMGTMGIQLGSLFGSADKAGKGLSLFTRMMALNSRMAAPLITNWSALGNILKGLSFSGVGSSMKSMLTSMAGLPAKLGVMTAATWRYVTAQLAASKALAATKFTAMTTGLRSATAATYAYVAANGVMGTTMNMIKGSVGGVISLLKGGLVGSLKLVGHTIAFVGRLLLMNPIGLLVTAIGIAALTIYRYWEPIKAFFSGFFQGLKEGLGPVAAVFAPAFEAMANALSPLKPIWDGISSALGSAWEWMTNLLTPIKTTQQELDGATNAGKRFGLWLGGLGKSFIQVIADFTKFGSDLIDGLLKGISDKWAELKTKISAMTDLLPDWWKGGSEVKASVSQSGYLTGNLSQPALAGGNGYGHRIADTPKLKPKVSTTTIHSQPFYQLTVNPAPGMNEAQLGKLVMDKLKESERANQAQGRARFGDRN
ncbi:phage tail tape measure protein [Aeromonas caviae]|uniref:phage tail tape measure protein n=2 Tax=Aeromonas caviae TaxID=648 RepID=UPI001941B626|nr:phage tail tape measure protein [Aeromonas caviae]BCR27461.1 phage tail tape measure protein [Aeromonas caviae]GJA97378.1 phage tail tape measure protein [Aeromonas caviae]GJB39868.1 phage tail tape measure protein [Aeromonas caviae]GJB44240.1 phage tail tape measure protein [Aeromonas caviae]GJB48874.1 phage tail tape measure protein [Aeromonas caviae]